jgi:N-methylhydantoinase A
MAMSGPAAGVSASVSIARQLGTSRMLTFDMGGTTTDVCLIIDGQAEMADGRMLGDRPLRQPMLAVHSIGAGGGSIVRNGPGGLTVGPQSAGSEPGPACYGRGGTEPTITDANAVLGYLNPETLLGDRIGLDIEAARRAIAPIAQALKLSLVETALGIVKVANATMARALRRVTVERGIDGRDCTLLAFGGGGPMHAAGLADLYGIGSIVVPNASSAFSALGCLTADFSFLQQQTFRVALDGIEPRDVVDVDQLLGIGEADLHHRQEALPTGKDASFATAFRLCGDGLVDAVRGHEVEAGREHTTLLRRQ